MRHKQPCPDCGSSDALSDYGEYTHCYSCNTHLYKNKKEDKPLLNTQPFSKAPVVPMHKKNKQEISGTFPEMTDRGISKATAEKYQVFTPNDTFYKYGYPLFRNGIHVANKFRLSGDKKGFSVDGDFNKGELFGQNLFPPGSSKTVTVTEGYEDAMAAFELQGSKYPCVSVHSASTARKDCADNFEYLNSFDQIVLCFDTDTAKILPDGTKSFPGQEAAQTVAALFPAKKVRVLTLQKAKDANDYLRAGLRKEFMDEWWKAPTWTPDGIILGTELWDAVSSIDDTEAVDYPFPGLTTMTYGMRLGQLVIITADTGVGKTQVLKEIEYYLLNHSAYGLGIMHLEESKRDTGLGIMSVEANLPLHLPDVRAEVTQEALRKYYDKTINTDRVVIYDHFGSNQVDDLLAKIRHMSAMGCKFVVLDHLSIVVSDQQNGDERKLLDEISTKIKTVCMELNICVVAVIHQNRSGQIRGTAGVEQLANIVIKLYRDKEADDPWRRNVTKVTVQKNRFCGKTGPACYLEYDVSTGRLQELDKTGIEMYESSVEGNNPFENKPW